MNKLRSNEKPDGGWGWVVVGAVVLINMTNQANPSLYVLLFSKVLTSNSFNLGLIMNLNSSAINFTGFFFGPLIKSFKPRNVAALGCLMVAFGLAFCAFAQEDWHFILGYSIFNGFGLGLITPSTFIAINSYFSSKRGRAVGVSLAGAGLSQIALPHLVVKLLELYGFRITVLAMSLLSLIGLSGAMLLKPLSPSDGRHNNRKHIRLLSESTKSENGLDIKIDLTKPLESIKSGSVYKETTSRKETTNDSQNKWCQKIWRSISQAMDLELFKDPSFLSIIIGMAIVYTSTVNFSTIYPKFLERTVGLTESNIALCMSVTVAADNICRLLLPCITDKLKVPYRVIFLLGTIGLLIYRSALAEATDFTTILILFVLIGIAKSATVLNNNLTISAHCCSEKLPGALGLNMVSKGVIVITFGQLLVWIRDYTQSYPLCLHAQNVLIFIVILVWSTELSLKYWKKRKEAKLMKIIKINKANPEATQEELAKINVC